MDSISGYSQVSEIIPFDYSQPFLLFPVRHHSPVCSWQLIRAIKEYQPDVILIEGPENAVMKPRTINAITLLSMLHLSTML